MMRPERVEHRGGKGLVLVHRCVVCGFVRPNRIADDPVQGDDIDAIIALMSKTRLAWVTLGRYGEVVRHEVTVAPDQGPAVRSSQCPASSRGHWGMGRPAGHSGAGGQAGGPPLVRVLVHSCGQPGGESSDDSWRPYTVRSMSA